MSDENHSMKKLLSVLKNAVSESGDDWENVIQKLGGSDAGSPLPTDGEDTGSQETAKKRRIRGMKDKMEKRNQDISVLDPDYVEQTFQRLAPTLSTSDLAIGEGKYPCVTQAQSSDTPTTSDPTSIILGLYGTIPRWRKNTTVNFAVYAGGWPSNNHAIFAAYRLNQAATTWNSLNLGVTFKWVGVLEDACFVLGYGGNGGDTLARAFFPNSKDLNNMYVYLKAFQSGYVNYLYNVFLHELGHVLGLRHEFAPEREGAGPLVVWGIRNPLSVMSYTFPPQLQPSDRIDTKSFYAYTGTTIRNVRIQDFLPNN
ncbi:catalytic domain-containingprotein [Alternaria burnsii]|uniref:Catalytic domain-containingprotein n=1 Tax=Alternaria burnsii TaxID=1187904 RepID=A0A8H7BD75_9PLEO|nr:catalytic domain-containingprotein [Alternaria burnsii]KAF7679589.1 catalytic domain-containingprotein [Alternaria burnsii]